MECTWLKVQRLVHYVPAAVVDDVDADGKVVVWWPRRNGGKRWEGRGVASKLVEYNQQVGSYTIITMYVHICIGKTTKRRCRSGVFTEGCRPRGENRFYTDFE